MNALRGLATGIGSLPHLEASPALDLIFQYTPHIPFWPQLPKRDPREGMVAQFSEGFPFLEITPEGVRFSALDAPDKELETFYEQIINNNVEHFAMSASYAAGFHAFCDKLKTKDLNGCQAIKGHITGPFTFAASIRDENGIALLHDAVFMQVIIKGLAMKALWQINRLRAFGKKIVMFLDEPYLGCFGSAYTPINKEDVVRGLSELTGAITAKDVMVGVHCCGNTDWSIFTEVETIDIINFDAFGFMEKFVLYADSLKAFLKKGGLICWGVVPTQEFNAGLSPDSLLAKIQEGITALVNKGVDKELLSEQLLISPACGLGTLGPTQAEAIFKALSETSSVIRKI